MPFVVPCVAPRSVCYAHQNIERLGAQGIACAWDQPCLYLHLLDWENVVGVHYKMRHKTRVRNTKFVQSHACFIQSWLA